MSPRSERVRTMIVQQYNIYQLKHLSFVFKYFWSQDILIQFINLIARISMTDKKGFEDYMCQPRHLYNELKLHHQTSLKRIVENV